MRISTSFFYSQGLQNMLEQQSKLLRVQDQLGQGVKNLSPSDDPSASARVLGLNQSITKIEQYDENAIYAKQRLELEESTLDSVSLVLQRVRELTVQVGNVGTGDIVTRKAITSEIKQRIDELLDLANTRDVNGDYLFAGFKSRTQPFFADGAGNYTYNGDQGQMDVKIGNTRQVTVSDSGADVFQRVRTGNGTFATDAGLVNEGSGIIRQGSLQNIEDYVAHDYLLQFRPEDELQSAKYTAPTTLQSNNYAAVPATFDIVVNDSAVTSITFNTDMTGQPPLVIAKAVADEINTTLNRDVVKGSVDTNGNLVIETLEKEGKDSNITFSNLAGDFAGLGITAVNVAGIPASTEDTKYFDILDLNLSPGTVTSADIGVAGVDIFDADQPSIISGAADLSLGADFDTGGPTFIELDVNGEQQSVSLSGVHNAAGVTGYIQTEINNAFGEGVVNVSRNATGNIVLETVEQGADIDMEVISVANNVIGFAAGAYDSGVDQNNQISIYLDGNSMPVEIELTAGFGITADIIAAEINAATGINATAPNSPITNEIVINSDQFSQTDVASLVFQGNALETLGINIVNTVVGQPAREYSAESNFSFDGHEVSIEGDPSGEDVFTIKASRYQDIFTSLDSLVRDLESPPNEENSLSSLAQLGQQVANTLANIAQGQENIINTRTGIGARLNSIDSQETQNFAQKNQFQKVRSDLVDLDYAEAITQLKFQLTALQASQQSFAQVQQLSLFDFI